MNHCRVLLVEDNAGDARLVQALLAEASGASSAALRFAVLRADRLHTALEIIAEQTFDAILLDLSLPDSYGLETVGHILKAAPATPLIVISGQSDEGIAVEAVHLGAQDYLVKGSANPALLDRAIRYAIERKRTQRALQESADQVQRILDSLPSQIAVIDRNGEIIAVNRAWRESAAADGDPRLEKTGIGVNYLEATRRDESSEAQEIVAGIEAVLNGSAPEYRREYPSHTPTEQRWFLLTVNPYSDHLGGAVISHTDISERKRRERELEVITTVSAGLRAAQTRNEMLPIILDLAMDLTHSQHGTFVLTDFATGENVVELAVGAWEALEGIRYAPGVGVTGWVVATGQVYITEDLGRDPRIPRPDAVRALQAALAVPLLAQDTIIGALWVGRNRAQRAPAPLMQRLYTQEDVRLLTLACDVAANAIRRATLTEQVEAYAQQVRRIMDAIDDGLILLNEEQQIEVANPAGIEYLQMLASAQIGDRLETLGGRPAAEVLAPAQELPHHELQVEGTVQRRFAASAQPLGSVSEPGGWVLVLRDVTLVHRMQQMAEQQARLAAVGQLAAGIAHDFNNIMAVVTLYADMLLRAPDLPPKFQPRLATINHQANRAIVLIRQILDFGRRALVERKPTNIVPFLEQMLELWKPMLPENVTPVLSTGQSEYIVRMDPNRLQQGLTNLILNARDAMAEGGRIEISAEAIYLAPGDPAPVHEMESGAWLRLSVADSGDGIPFESLPHIFEPFFTTKAPGKGSGLGLAQVYGIVKQHDGYVTVSSRPGEGASFAIYLPLLSSPTSGDPADSASFADADSSTPTVLLIEDNRNARETVDATLRGLGYRVLAVPDGNAAIELAQGHSGRIDLVLGNLGIPGTEGLDFFKALAALRPNLKLIVTHDAPLKDARLDLTEPGIVGRLQKPYTVSDIAAKVATIINPPVRGRHRV